MILWFCNEHEAFLHVSAGKDNVQSELFCSGVKFRKKKKHLFFPFFFTGFHSVGHFRPSIGLFQEGRSTCLAKWELWWSLCEYTLSGDLEVPHSGRRAHAVPLGWCVMSVPFSAWVHLSKYGWGAWEGLLMLTTQPNLLRHGAWQWMEHRTVLRWLGLGLPRHGREHYKTK